MDKRRVPWLRRPRRNMFLRRLVAVRESRTVWFSTSAAAGAPQRHVATGASQPREDPRLHANCIVQAKGFTLLAACACLALVAGLSGCDSSRKQREAEPVRELNEIPIAQLRVMLKGFPGEWRPESDRDQQRAEPPAEKTIPAGAKRIALVPLTDIHLGDMPVREAIAARRSTRDFSETALSLEELSFLLWATQGVTAVQRDDAGAIVQRFRAAPSAGARYPIETYLAISRVQGVAAGIYRYVPNDHELVLVREDAQVSGKLMAACYGTPSVGSAAVVFIWSAVPYRTEWKYTYLAHRMIAMEAGHVCENLYLAAESCRTGACAVLSYHQPRVDELLGVDGKEEFALYLACVGKPKADEK